MEENRRTTIDLSANRIAINGVSLTFPLSLQDVERILGKPDKTTHCPGGNTKYVFSALGAVFEASAGIENYLKSRRVYISPLHNIMGLSLYFGRDVEPMTHETPAELPETPCKAVVTCDGSLPDFYFDRARAADFALIYWTPYGTNARGTFEEMQYPLTISYSPEREREPASYKIKKCKEETLHFDNLNFKLAIIQVLMYDQETLQPYFDIYDFADQYQGKEIDTESTENIKPALNFFNRLPIPARLATQVEEIYMDGGNDIYMNIAPQWDGEDGRFSLNEISVAELAQFPNLKRATLLSDNYDEVKKVFEKVGVEVELL